MSNRQQEYEQLLRETLRAGSYLAGPGGRQLSTAAWGRAYAQYCERLDQLRRLCDDLRPPLAAEPPPCPVCGGEGAINLGSCFEDICDHCAGVDCPDCGRRAPEPERPVTRFYFKNA